MSFFPFPALYAEGKSYFGRSSREFDVIVISGDAYVDHPAFPAAAITRFLESLNLSVAVIAQPDWRSEDDFKYFGRPSLFFAVAPGAMDSMVANFTSMKMPRKTDRLSHGGRTGLRPKRASQVYCQILRRCFPDTPIVLGGIEGSLRRFSHYDFWENAVRDPILIDAPADILVYGMGEVPLLRIVEWYKSNINTPRLQIPRIPQTCIKVPHGMGAEIVGSNCLFLPSAKACRENPEEFLKLAITLDSLGIDCKKCLVQEHQKGDIVCFPPLPEDFDLEIELVESAKYNRMSHPLYELGVPALVPVQFSLISHRGCVGRCTFCALAIHQGRRIRSRSIDKICAEAKTFVNHCDFKGTIPDIGGPSANMYGWDFKFNSAQHGLKKCVRSISPLIEVFSKVAQIPGIRNVFLGSGLRYDLIEPSQYCLLEEFIRKHVSGQLKVAPEHVDSRVLKLMRKGSHEHFIRFLNFFREFTTREGLKKFLVPYFMTAFPGAGEADKLIAEFVRKEKLVHEQIQDFTPTPGTLASAMFYVEKDFNGNPIKVAKKHRDRKFGRNVIQNK